MNDGSGWRTYSQYEKAATTWDDVRLVFHPAAWIKLMYLCHGAKTEVCCFGVALDHTKPLYVNDLLVPEQECTTGFCDPDMADLSARAEPLFQELPDGRVYNPAGTALWIHTHPAGMPATPSGHDETTFAERGGDWAVMFILSQSGDVSCRLRANTPFGRVCKEIGVDVDWKSLVGHWKGGFIDVWDGELKGRVKEKKYAAAAIGYAGAAMGYGPYKDVPGSYDETKLPASYLGRGRWRDRQSPFGETWDNGKQQQQQALPTEYRDAWAVYTAEEFGGPRELTTEEIADIVADEADWAVGETRTVETDIGTYTYKKVEKQTEAERLAQQRAHDEIERARVGGDFT